MLHVYMLYATTWSGVEWSDTCGVYAFVDHWNV